VGTSTWACHVDSALNGLQPCRWIGQEDAYGRAQQHNILHEDSKETRRIYSRHSSSVAGNLHKPSVRRRLIDLAVHSFTTYRSDHATQPPSSHHELQPVTPLPVNPSPCPHLCRATPHSPPRTACRARPPPRGAPPRRRSGRARSSVRLLRRV
jgi:hypothetical protein